jgi:AcrR family transcriptional regulator
MGMTTTRRERARAATIDEIKQAALDQIANEGAAALSIRGIARAIGMSPAGLYRYYEGLDALITELIADAYNDLADAVEAATARPGDVRARLREAMLAYRRWSIEQPNRFLLIFGTPIPGYAAPEEGPTVHANRRIGEAFFSVLVEGWATGEICLQDIDRRPEPGEVAFAAQAAPGFPAEWIAPFLGTWASFHGMVTLEILNQLDWVYPDAGGFYRSEIDRMIAAWDGLTTL